MSHDSVLARLDSMAEINAALRWPYVRNRHPDPWVRQLLPHGGHVARQSGSQVPGSGVGEDLGHKV
jgi:hypothetical protein